MHHSSRCLYFHTTQELYHTCELLFHGDPVVEAIDSNGKVITCSSYGIVVKIPPDTIPQSEKVVLQIQSCLGNFVLPEGIRMASPAYLLTSTAAIQLNREIEVSIVHFIHLEDEEDCSDMCLITAPLIPKPSHGFMVRMGYHFQECREMAIFRPHRVLATFNVKYLSTCIIAAGKREHACTRSPRAKG